MDKGAVHALQHLAHFFSSFFSSKEFWAALVGAVIGGVMAMLSALYTQKQAVSEPADPLPRLLIFYRANQNAIGC